MNYCEKFQILLMTIFRTLFLLLFFFLMAPSVFGQASVSVLHIDTIYVEGNARTRSGVILRELDFAVGDSLAMDDLQALLERNTRYLMNTGLFNRVLINVRDWDVERQRIGILVEVEEGWYFYPIPLFDLADRNFNVWWRDYQRDLRRINLGVYFRHSNFSGRMDAFKLKLQLGFTRKLEAEYDLPFFDVRRHWGLGFNLLLSDSKYLRYNTYENREQFVYFPDKRILQRFRLSLSLRRRPALRSTQRLELGFYRTRIDTLIATDYNPDFLGEGRSLQRYFFFRYAFEWDGRDIRPYPRRGLYLLARFEKLGLGLFGDLQAAYADMTLRQYWPAAQRAGFELVFRTRLALQRGRQPYYNSRALGYEEDYLRGYEYYLIDGLDWAFAKCSFHLPLLYRVHEWGRLMPFRGFRQMPLRVYLSFHAELGYVNNPYHAEGNSFANAWLPAYGIGLDIVSYYDKVVLLEVSRNKLGEIGFFLHWRIGG
ncbi:MAG TPA: hypothetical protein ENJ88_09030 [Phaeodactylibacter sp.]|nr:hypothetical protein [Phaeodactylibacter sp.]